MIITTETINSLSSELRSVIEYRKQKPRTPKFNKVKKVLIILCCLTYLLISFLGGIKSHAEEEPEPHELVYPTDLTGYTVTVPADFTATAGYGNFSVTGSFVSSAYNDEPIDTLTLFVGYAVFFDEMPTVVTSSNTVTFTNSQGFPVYPIGSGSSFSFTVDSFGGNNHASLIQWLVDNNATFVNNNEPEEPTFVTVSAGLYYLQNTYNDLRGTINFSVPFISKSTYFNAITFAGIDNEQYVSINYAGDNILPNVYNGTDGWSFAEYSVIYVQSDVELSQTEYALFERAFVSFADNPKLDILFQAGQQNGQSAGYSQGFNAGRTEGYNEGFTAGRSDALGDNFMGDFFGGIVRALDALKLFGDISMLNIIEAIIGIMLALWILKLIAGG